MYFMMMNPSIEQVHDQMLLWSKYSEACFNYYEGVVQIEAGIMKTCSDSLKQSANTPYFENLESKQFDSVSRQMTKIKREVSQDFELLMEELL